MTKRKIARTAIEKLAESDVDVHPLVQKYREDLILHVQFQAALDQLADRIHYSDQQGITAVIGPTSSGKTALTKEFAFQYEAASEKLPVDKRSSLLTLELASPESGAFKWKDDLYVPALHALGEPCVSKKIDVDSLRDRLALGNVSSAFGKMNLTVSTLRKLFFSALERARVKAILFDEANHLRQLTSKQGIFAQYDSLKSRSNQCQSHFVLIGTTETTDIFRQSGPISKRVYPIWLSPYGVDDIDKFGGAVLSIVEKLPVKVNFQIETKLDELFQGALGLYGLIHDWFDRVLVKAISLERKSISWADMEAQALHPIQLAGIIKEIIAFREVQEEVLKYLKEQRKSLFTPAEIPKPSNAPSPRGRTPPGTRKPGRDKVAP